MILLISSGATRRYSDDIFRALAHPHGTDFQFRYDVAHLDPAVLALVEQRKLAGQRALIAYLHTDQLKSVAELTSVRAVTIKRVELVGTSCVLTLTASDYVHPLDDAMIRKDMSAAEADLIPAWKGGALPVGAFAIQVAKDIHSGRVAATGKDMLAFEETAIALSKYPPFAAASGMAFYAVRGIAGLETPKNQWFAGDQAPRLEGDRYMLRSGIRYRFDIYSYRPAGSADDAPSVKLLLSTDEKAVQLTSTKEAALDSRYDLKRFSFTTDQFLNDVPAAIRFALEVSGGTPAKTEQRCDITINTVFGGSRRQAVARTILIAAGTASSAIIGVAFKDQFGLGVALLMCVGPVIAAGAATFPLLRKWS
jgi:hypothetical protein